MFKWLKNKFGEKGKTLIVGSCLILSILTMTIATFAWFTTVQPGTDKMVLKSDDNSVIVDAYAYKPGYTTNSNGDPVEAAHSDHSATPLLAATRTDGAGSASYTVTFSSEALSTFSYASLYGDELFTNESKFPHLYIEFRYIKPNLNGFVKATVANFAYAQAVTGYTDITSSLQYEYRVVTEQNLATGTKYKSGFTAAYADSNYTATAWTSLSDGADDFSLYNNTTDISGYSYGASYVMQKQCFVPGYAYMYDSTNYYYSKATFLEFRINPISWMNYFRTHTTSTNSSSSAVYSLGLLSFGVNFNINLDFSNNPFYDSAASTSPRVALSASLINMKPSTTDSGTTVTTYNFSGTPTFAVEAANNAIVSGSVSGGVLTLTTTATTGTTTVIVTATYGSESAQGLITVRCSGPTLTLSPTSISIKMGGTGSVIATTYNFDNAVTLSAISNSTSIATIALNGSSITITPVAVGSTTMTVTATDGSATRTADCSIVIAAADKTLSSIAVTTQPTTTTYVVGDVLDTTGCVITATWSDQSTTVVTSSCSFSPSDLDTIGTQVITVSYGGKTTTFTVTVLETANTYQLVTSSSQLISGGHYVISSGYADNSATPVMGTTSTSGNNRLQTTIEVSSSALTPSDATEIITLGGSTGAWTMFGTKGVSEVTHQAIGYFYAASSTSNYLRTETSLQESETNDRWTISIATSSPYVATITANGSNSNNILRYNSNSSLFSCYGSGNSQNDVYLFKEVKTTTKTLSSLTMTSEPTKTIYTQGEALNTAGLVITANYSDNTSAVVTDYTLNPANGSTLSTSGEIPVTVSYTEGGVTKTTAFSVSVNPAPTSIAVTTMPTKTTYIKDDAFNTAGMVVTATYSDGGTSVVTGWTTSPANGATLSTVGTVAVTVTYGALTTQFNITVNQVTTGSAVYTITSASAVTTGGTAPTGSSVSYKSTYSTKYKLTGGNSMTWTISNLSNVTITSLTFSMKSNSSSGAGKIYYAVDGGDNVYLAGSSSSGVGFNTSGFYGAWSTTFVDVSKTGLSIAAGSSITITIAATANSLYCRKLTMGWSQGS
jgi:hypothetical protein